MPEETDSRLLRALLIEDNSFDCNAIQDALIRSESFAGCDHISLISDVERIIQEATSTYDVVITNINLPDSSGLNTVSALLKVVGKVPIVVISDIEENEVGARSVSAGAQDYIPKRYIWDANLLNRMLLSAIERHKLKLGLKAFKSREKYLAYYDRCTDLPNRMLFLDRIYQTIVQAKRNDDKFALFFLGLDRFKQVNDSIGHIAGDEVLRCVSARLLKLTRESDTVARYGGDEFVVIFQRSENINAMKVLAGKLIEAVNQPIPYGHQVCTVGASIGIACFPRHGNTPELLIKNAHIAADEAKHRGRNRAQFFSQELFERKNNAFCLEKALREALREPDKYFELHYQPRIELMTGKVRSVEALIRWRHDTLGHISPSKFIPLAEELGLIGEIDEWVVNAACKTLDEWRSINQQIQVGINISGCSFNRYDFVNGLVKDVLQKYGLDGNCLEIEITESILLSDVSKVEQHLKQLKTLGVSLAIDDFGTGFSSLSYLNKYPIDTLKIDGSFICDHRSDYSDQSLLKAIVSLGKTLGMKVVAECVENDEQRNFLQSVSCHEGQGFYWGKPHAGWIPKTVK